MQLWYHKNPSQNTSPLISPAHCVSGARALARPYFIPASHYSFRHITAFEPGGRRRRIELIDIWYPKCNFPAYEEQQVVSGLSYARVWAGSRIKALHRPSETFHSWFSPFPTGKKTATFLFLIIFTIIRFSQTFFSPAVILYREPPIHSMMCRTFFPPRDRPSNTSCRNEVVLNLVLAKNSSERY